MNFGTESYLNYNNEMCKVEITYILSIYIYIYNRTQICNLNISVFTLFTHLSLVFPEFLPRSKQNTKANAHEIFSINALKTKVPCHHTTWGKLSQDLLYIRITQTITVKQTDEFFFIEFDEHKFFIIFFSLC